MPDETCDVVVIGSGAGGLATAAAAALKGLKVIVLEKADLFGGTSALSGGGIWVPNNPIAQRLGISDSREAARTYFLHSSGNRFDAARVDAYLDKSPEMVVFFEKNGLPFIVQTDKPDYHTEMPGASQGGRTVYPAPYNARSLGKEVERLRPPLKQMSLHGMAIRAQDVPHYVNVFRSFESFKVVTRRIARYLWDLAAFGRPMSVANGNALIVRLAEIAFKNGVEIRTSSSARDLIVENGGVAGVAYETGGLPKTLRAQKGVVLAAGGFPHEPDRWRKNFPGIPIGPYSMSVDTASGDGIRMAERAGSEFNADVSDAAPWIPVSLVPDGNGKTVPFPHLIDRPRPGFIAVTRDGKRFVNESDSYHDFVRELLKQSPSEAWLVADHRAIRRYGIGYVKPSPFPIGPHIRSGYLTSGRTLEELAERAGIDGATLSQTVEHFNRHARTGADPEFNRGTTVFNRAYGDPLQKPNPCLAPIETGPFYAVKIYPGNLGTFAGIKTDAYARVLHKNGRPIEGLYAVGNDQSNVMAGDYLGAGANLGPAMTFGYIAACDLAAR